MSGPSRRDLLAGVAALAAAPWTGCREPSPAPLTGSLGGMELAGRGHRVREPLAGGHGALDTDEAADVVIVGAGVAGLAAAWRLKQAGFAGTVKRLEISEAAGGTAASGVGPFGPYALGAHYVTLPNAGNRVMRALLTDLGVLEGGTVHGYDPMALCFAPQERLFHLDRWEEGIWPSTAGAAATAQRRDFEALVEAWTWRRGADGLPAFDIPVAGSSRDPTIRALAEVSFGDWLAARGYDAPALLWWLSYGCRDDYGCDLGEVSAWAGMHYHCARRPAPGEDTETRVLTWPAGNGWLVSRIDAGLPWPLTGGAVARRVEGGSGQGAGGVRVWYERGGALRGVRAKHVILAVPTRVADRLVERPARALTADSAPWRVAVLHCERAPEARGVGVAWDSVVYGAEDLGYVSSAHQTGSYGGPTALTWYQPWTGEPRAARRRMLEASWEEGVEAVMASLAMAHPTLREVVRRVDVHHWGHGTARPVVGLHTGEALAQAAAGLEGVSFAHTDLSGVSLFEEALWHGVRAGEEALAALEGEVSSLL